MYDYPFIEKRSAPRFPVTIPVTYCYADSGDEFSAQTQNISSGGLGIVTYREVLAGDYLNVCLHMADNGEKIYRRGRVAWVSQLSQDKYRVGLQFEGVNLKPISIVLRTIISQQNY